MVFLYPQVKHPLIPQAQAETENVALAKETRESRQEFFGLLHHNITTLSDEYSETDDPELVYRQIRQQLDNNPAIQAAHEKRRILQDRLWQRVAEDIKSDRDYLGQQWEQYQQIDRGKVEFNPDFNYPLHQLKAEIHRMPGGYLQDRNQADFWTGLVYDHGVFLYGQGWFGGLNDELGHTIINNVLGEYYPEFVPQKILDLGCSVGHSTIPYKLKYSDAEVWGIDIGASLLRYASARAKALGQTIYFAQQNAEKTDFADNSCDLVVSHILFHEIPCGARKKVFAESYRLLKKGGLMVHLESQLFLSPPNMMARYFRDTEVWVNSEPYLGSSKLADFTKYALAAGFSPQNFQLRFVPGYYALQRGENKQSWIAFCGRKE